MLKTISLLEEDQSSTDNLKRPEVLIALAWLKDNLHIVNPVWRFQALQIFSQWISRHGNDPSKIYRRFISQFLDDTYDNFYTLCDLSKNNSGTCDWAYTLSYVMTSFYFLEEICIIYEYR